MRRTRRRKTSSHRRRPRTSLKKSRYITKFRPGIHRTTGNFRRSGPREIKYQDRFQTNKDFQDGVTETNVSFITGIAEGSGRSDRIGRKISCVGLEINGTITFLSNTAISALPAYTVRAQIWLDTQANGTQAGSTDFNEIVNDIHSFPRQSNLDRFKLLKQKVWDFHIPSALDIPATFPKLGHMSKSFQWKLKFPSIPIHYSSTSGTISEVRSNNIFIYWAANDDGQGILSARYRLHYTDRN